MTDSKIFPLFAPAPTVADAFKRVEGCGGTMGAMVMLATVQRVMADGVAELLDTLARAQLEAFDVGDNTRIRAFGQAHSMVREWADRAGIDLPPME